MLKLKLHIKILGGKIERKELKFEVLNDLETISESTKGWIKKLTRIIWNEDGKVVEE